MDWTAITSDPVVVAAAVAVLGTIGVGLKKVWTALIAATVRTLEHVGVDDEDEQEIVRKARKHNSLMRTMPANVIIDQAKLRRSIRPPGDDQ